MTDAAGESGPTLADEGGGAYRARRIFCVGKNYAAHASEMGWTDREPPFFFAKFADTLINAQAGPVDLPYPPETQDLQYEGELVVALASSLWRADVGAAASAVQGFAAGLDMTRRDLQLHARRHGRPWDLGKNAFPGAAIVGRLSRATPAPDARLQLAVNGAVRQDASLGDMIWSWQEVLADLSRYTRLEPGDLVFTGTPAGVGPVAPGDSIALAIDGLSPVAVTVTDARP